MYADEELCRASSTQQQASTSPTSSSDTLDAMEQLRVLLLGADYQVLTDLRQQILDRERYSLHVAEVISEALVLRAQQDNSLSDALSPTIEAAVSRSVESNPTRLANALYPVMGPAIRKSVQEVLHHALETFNYLLEQSLSLRSIAWRFDAWRTGRSYSEVVLLKTLVYQVEQVVLIHRETGLLLQHVVSPQAITKDPEVVSSMMTVIQDFIRDSFDVASDSSLKTLHLDDVSVLFNQGPYAVLAAIVRGNPPAELTTTLAEVNEQIHRQTLYFLKHFQGNSQQFKIVLPLLERCLKSQLKRTKRFPWFALFAFTALFSLSAWMGWQYYQQQLAAKDVLKALQTEPGIVVVNFEKTQAGYEYDLLKDPLARDPSVVIQAWRNLETPLLMKTKPFLSMDDAFVLARATQILQPAKSVQLKVDKQQLLIAGIADLDWKRKLDEIWPSIAGIESIDTTHLKVEDQKAAKLQERLRLLALQVEAASFNFVSGSSALTGVEEHSRQIVPMLLDLLSVARETGKILQVSISGAADETGTELTNSRLAKERAFAMRDYLLTQGVPAAILATPTPDNGRRDERSIHYQVDLF